MHPIRNLSGSASRMLFPAVVMAVVVFSSCAKDSPTESEPGLDLEQEASLVPWSIITGKLAYSRQVIQESGPHGFVSYLFIIDGNAKQVTLVKEIEGLHFKNLAWKNDGTTITYSHYEYELSTQLYSIGVDGSDPIHIYSSDAHNNYPSWSRNNHLAYWYNGLLSSNAIWIDNESFFDEVWCNHSRPAWSPDSNFLVISMNDSTSQGALYRVSVTDTSRIAVLQGTGEHNDEIFDHPIYSPDGTRIAFTKYGRSVEDSEIWIVNADGTNPLGLTSGHTDYYPAWSPDGNYIAFVRFTLQRIFIVDVDGGEIIQVTANEAQYPIWIP